MTQRRSQYLQNYDLSNCDAEPLAFIRQIQAGALLLVVDKMSGEVEACSENSTDVLGLPTDEIIGQNLNHWLPAEPLALIEQGKVENPLKVRRWADGSENHLANLLVWIGDSHWLLEFESRDESVSRSSFLLQMDVALQNIQATVAQGDAFQAIAQQVQMLTAYDRVMIYRFDQSYNGQVIAEVKNESVPSSYLGLHFPHTDIPKQARDLYQLNQVRIITDTNPKAVSWIHSRHESQQIDLSLTANRAASPLHLEYLKNIGVAATMSVAIIVNGDLWGLIACHHYTSKRVDFRVRSMVAFFGRIISGHLALRESQEIRQQSLRASVMKSRLFERMSLDYDVVSAFEEREDDLLNLVSASGAALLLDQQVHRFGSCPSEAEVRELGRWLAEKATSRWSSESMYEHFARIREFNTAPAGLLALQIVPNSEEYLLWFRPEVIKTIKWGGRPDQRKEVVDGQVRLHPELSFRQYEQQVSGLAEPWTSADMDYAIGLRNDIKEVILIKYKELRQLNEELVDAYQELETFSYTVSHDLRAPLRNIKGFAEILLEDYEEKLDDYGISVLKTITESVGKMNQFISDILTISRFGRSKMEIQPIDLEELLKELWQELGGPASGVNYIFEASINEIYGDLAQTRAMFLNLLSNAIKYRKQENDAFVRITAAQIDQEVIISVADNGRGFHEKFAERIFIAFERLVSNDEIEGTGIGLAIVKRSVENHNGRIEVISEEKKGTEFRIFWPNAIS